MYTCGLYSRTIEMRDFGYNGTRRGKRQNKGKLRAGTSQIGVDLTVSPSCWIITVWQMVLEENSRCLCAAGDENFTIGDISFCLVFLANDGGGLALRQKSNEQGGLWQLRSR